MIPRDEGALLLRAFHSDQRIVGFQEIGIVDEECAQMTERFAACDLSTGNDGYLPIGRRFFRNFVGIVQIAFQIMLIQMLLDMIGDRHNIQTLFPGFIDAGAGPNHSVGENRMDMEITFPCLVIFEIRNVDPSAFERMVQRCKLIDVVVRIGMRLYLGRKGGITFHQLCVLVHKATQIDAKKDERQEMKSRFGFGWFDGSLFV